MNISIDNFIVGSGRVYVIAEIGNNHNGSFNRAIQMIDLAVSAGADCVKFQMRQMSEVYRDRSLNKDGEDLGTEYLIDLLHRFELTVDQHIKLSDYCKSKGITYLCTPWDSKSISILEKINVKAYKVASADLSNIPLLVDLIRTDKPIILSTGMSTPEEIEITVNFLNSSKANYVLLHCNSAYPAPLQDINLRWMDQLRKLHPLIGYSGHERGINVTLAAVTLGASIIERHFTLDREMEGPDHAASLTPEEFQRMVVAIREIELALGDGQKKHLSQGEMINRESLGKSLISSSALVKGTIIRPEHIKVRSPGQGLSPQCYKDLVGRVLNRNMAYEDFFFMTDITEEEHLPREYKFSRPWGIPIRFHDYGEYRPRINPDIWEFHLSYSDLEVDPSKFLFGKYDEGFIVHAPELFSGSHLLDLVTPDNEYRKRSLMEMQRVIEMTRSLKQFFPKTKRPMIVANIGGFSMDGTLPKTTTREYYQRFSRSMHELDLDGVEIIPQTMAPFPWHFGGQRYQNLFITIDEIVEWCGELNLRMCFDVSHSKLAANHLGIDFYNFCYEIAPITGHLHLGDAKGVNGEGLQIGEGEIDFVLLGNILQERCPDASFIPEVWQGHKNHGEGFWLALERLEGKI